MFVNGPGDLGSMSKTVLSQTIQFCISTQYKHIVKCQKQLISNNSADHEYTV